MSTSESIRAIQSLFRVRGTESEPDGNGVRQVWHQGPLGADLISEVDRDGRVLRQELTLRADHFEWVARKGLTTGQVQPDTGSQSFKGAVQVVPDGSLKPDRVHRAHAALSEYSGDDRYILHIRGVVGLTVDGLQALEEVVVTRAMPAPAAVLRLRRRERLRRWAGIGAAVLATTTVVVLVYLVVG